MFCLKSADRFLGLLRLIVLARLLLPEDFGLLAAALFVVNGLMAFSEMGLKEALIQKKEAIAGYLGTAWWINVLRTVVLTAVLWGVAPLVARLFGEQSLVGILRVMSLALVCGGLINPHIALLQRELKFNRYFLFASVGSITEACVSILLALWLRNAWALVWGYIFRNAALMIASYVFCPPPASFVFLRSKARELFSFAKHIFVSGFLKFLISSGVDGFIAATLGIASLGLYQLGNKVSQLPTTEVTQHLFSVAFPVYARLQEDRARLREGYLLMVRSAVFFSFPLAGLLFVFAEEIVFVFFGAKWLPMVPALRILCIYGLLRSIDYGSLFMAVGRPEIITRITWVRFCIVAVTLYPLCRFFGIAGVAFSVFLGALGVEGWASYRMCRILDYPFREFWRGIFYPFLAMVLMALFMLWLKTVYPADRILPLFFIIAAGLCLYLGIVFIMNKRGVFPLTTIVRRIKEALGDTRSYVHEDG